MTTSERPRRADARRNYDRLLAAAREVFTEHGSDAPIDEVARRAGVGPGTLYRHFPTRQALLFAVYCEDLEAFVDTVRAQVRGLPPAEGVEVWLRQLVDHTKQRQGLGSAVRTMLTDEAKVFDFCRQLVRDAVEETLSAARAQRTVRADVQAADLLRLAHGVGTAVETAPQEGDRLLGFILDGLQLGHHGTVGGPPAP